MTHRPRLAAALILGAMLMVSGSLIAAPKGKLSGSWQASMMDNREGKLTPLPKGMTLKITFAPAGKFKVHMAMQGQAKSEDGTWKEEGNKVTTTVKQKTETMAFVLKDANLTLTKDGTKQRLVLVRASE